MKKTYTLLLLVVFITTQTYAQGVEAQLSRFDKQSDVATANEFFDALLKAEFLDEKVVFGKDTPKDSLHQQVWWWGAEWLYAEQKFKEAEQYALKALPLFADNSLGKADCLNTLGCIYVRLGNFQKAANYAKQSVDIEVKGGDHDRISSSMNTLAGIYMAAFQAQDAEKYILQALEHAEKVDNPGRKAILLGMASEIYHSLKDDRKALSYAEQAYEIEQKLGCEQKKMIRLSQKASALIGLHRYKEAEEALRMCIPALKEMGNFHSMAIDLNKLGMSLLCQERQQEAIPYYKEAAEWFSKMGDLYNEIHSNRGLYESYWTLNPDSAKFYLDRFDLLKDSLYNHATAAALQRYNAEFGNDQLQKENEQVRSEHRRTIVIALLVFAFLALSSWLTIRRMRQWQRQKMQHLICKIEQLEGTLASSADQPVREEALTPAEEAETDDNRKFLMTVIEVVHEGLPKGEYGVEQIAQKLCMSVSTFRRRLMNAAGESPKSYISAIQMEHATTLLTEDPDMQVSKVASLCGFSETSSFTNTFKRIYGCSPKQYREQSLKR